MKTEQIKEINTLLALIESEMGRIRVMMREASEQTECSSSELPNNYSHLLPEGYEFCEECEAEKVVKVLMIPLLPEHKQRPLGGVVEPNKDINMEHYRPIRKTPNPSYAVDWSNAPDWADVHCFEKNTGYWIGAKTTDSGWKYIESLSYFTLPDDLDWKLSKTLRPQ